ncbi:MAG: hypothetical protein AAFO01_02405, partial [Pseudomonadota bacterium]
LATGESGWESLLEPAIGWFGVRAGALEQGCDRFDNPAARQTSCCSLSTLLAEPDGVVIDAINDVAKALPHAQRETHDLLPFPVVASDGPWIIQRDRVAPVNVGRRLQPVRLTERTLRRHIDGLIGQGGPGIHRYVLPHDVGTSLATSRRAPRVAALAWKDTDHLITQAAFPQAANDSFDGSHGPTPLADQTVLRRPGAVLSTVLKGRRRATTPPIDDGGVQSKGLWAIDTLPTEEPPRLTLLDAVPGDREKPLVFDDGWILANGLKVPLGRLTWSSDDKDSKGGAISLMPFVDTGTVWNTEIVTYPVASDPFGIGAGIGWQITDATDMRLGVDIPVVSNAADGEDEASQLGFQFRLATSLGD